MKKELKYIYFTMLFLSLNMYSIPVIAANGFFDNIKNTFLNKQEYSVNGWKHLIERNKTNNNSKWVTLNNINSFFNHIRFVSDKEQWNKEDYWATPLEFLSSKGGDCEDYAIAKYFTLLKVGVPDKNMGIAYMKTNKNKAHMVLMYYKNKTINDPLILDNIDPKIKTLSKRTDLIPVYKFNSKKLWLFKKNKFTLVGSPEGIIKWVNLKNRIEKYSLYN